MFTFIVLEEAKEKYLLELPHFLYHEFSIQSFKDFQTIYKELSKLNTENKQLTYQFKLAKNNILLYSALTLEAFINYYAIRYKIPFHTDLERNMQTLTKWKMYPTLKTGKCLSSEALKSIKYIFQLRDEIVHPKAERINVRGFDDKKERKSVQAKIERMDPAEILIDINTIFFSLFNIDEDEEKEYKKSNWLYRVEKAS